MKRPPKWEQWEDEILRQNYKPERRNAGIYQCMRLLPNRSLEGIKTRAQRIGITLRINDVAGNFFRRVIVTPGCWIWKGLTDPRGYGICGFEGRRIFAHRLSYDMHFGAFEKDLCVCHKCDNPSCVNPDHLFLGTQEENMLDMISKGRQAGGYGLVKGRSKLTEEHVQEIINSPLRVMDLARKFGVHYSTISNIRSGRSRRDVKRGAA